MTLLNTDLALEKRLGSIRIRIPDNTQDHVNHTITTETHSSASDAAQACSASSENDDDPALSSFQRKQKREGIQHGPAVH
ncbi:hypothetical protein HOF56_05090 [Candidatus Peribacteria bacterium]|jgi:hypothetical protein|nr:hypothetical protein [Candidatus Peribacteria bacterium]MBT4021125.1 hypothetical protein [Candidatus Peribacteria bacterium]MBT4240719.1 hypothetical protein [Candidatus Peribacteria bacterium]MBT4474383.1 hypothetical protein [Candidatus Peribacteria bacterium]